MQLCPRGNCLALSGRTVIAHARNAERSRVPPVLENCYTWTSQVQTSVAWPTASVDLPSTAHAIVVYGSPRNFALIHALYLPSPHPSTHVGTTSTRVAPTRLRHMAAEPQGHTVVTCCQPKAQKAFVAMGSAADHQCNCARGSAGTYLGACARPVATVPCTVPVCRCSVTWSVRQA